MKKYLYISILLVLSLFGSTLFASAQFDREGTIRGTVRQDPDGDGNCAGESIVASFPIRFNIVGSPNSVSLVTGANGTYGLVSVDPGTWRVTAVPPSSRWTVTSQNPRTVNVTLDRLVVLGVDFCVQASGAAVVNIEADVQRALIEVENLASFSGQPPSRDLERNYAISEQLLTTDMPNPPYDELEEYVEEEGEEVEVVEQPPWLEYVNQFRTMGNLPILTEASGFTQGSLNHSRFMVVNDECCAHSENINNPLYTASGYDAAVNGNIFSSSWIGNDMQSAVNFWISAPFHLIGIIDPALTEVGYGDFRQEIGVFHMGAVLDVRSNANSTVDVPDSAFPTYFPGDGSETFIVRRSLPEWPEPLAHPTCAGFSIPTGPALMMMVGNGDKTPIVTSARVLENGNVVESCFFTEASYQNPNAYAQLTGRSILNQRDAVVIIPRRPLLGGATYRVEVTVNGEEHAWEFTVRQQ